MSTLRIVTAPQSRAEVIRTLAAQVGPTRVQPGCLRCDLYQDIENREIIVLVEEWEAQGELDRRLRSEDYRVVLAAIDLAQAPPVIHFDTVTRRTGSGGRGSRTPRTEDAGTVRASAMVHMRGRDTAVEADRTSRATPTPGTAERAGSDEARGAGKRIGQPG